MRKLSPIQNINGTYKFDKYKKYYEGYMLLVILCSVGALFSYGIFEMNRVVNCNCYCGICYIQLIEVI